VIDLVVAILADLANVVRVFRDLLIMQASLWIEVSLLLAKKYRLRFFLYGVYGHRFEHVWLKGTKTGFKFLYLLSD
jgi:hypothetical protein